MFYMLLIAVLTSYSIKITFKLFERKKIFKLKKNSAILLLTMYKIKIF